MIKKNSWALFVLLCGVVPLRSEVQELRDSHPVVVIGGGVGALTSAIYLARAGVKTIVIEGKNPGGALALSPLVQNWPGEYEISGLELMEKIHSQAEKNGVEFKSYEVIGVDFKKYPLQIKLADIYDRSQQSEILASACIIATGSQPQRLGIPAEERFWLKGVYSCAVCDGPFFKDKVVAVVGGGDAAVLEAQHLCQIAKKVVMIVRGSDFKGVEKLRIDALKKDTRVEFIFDAIVEDLRGENDRLKEIAIVQKSGRKIISADALFLAIGSRPVTQVFSGHLPLDSRGYIITREDGATAVPGVYAVGDVVDPIYRQAVSAAGAGAKAALSLQQYMTLFHGKRVQELPCDLQAPAEVIEIKDVDQFKKEISSSKTPVVVDFYASWCPPCRHIAPLLDIHAKDLQGKIKILKVNVNTLSSLADTYQIKSMPTLITVDSLGKVVDRRLGSAEILQYLKTFY